MYLQVRRENALTQGAHNWPACACSGVELHHSSRTLQPAKCVQYTPGDPHPPDAVAGGRCPRRRLPGPRHVPPQQQVPPLRQVVGEGGGECVGGGGLGAAGGAGRVGLRVVRRRNINTPYISLVCECSLSARLLMLAVCVSCIALPPGLLCRHTTSSISYHVAGSD